MSFLDQSPTSCLGFAEAAEVARCSEVDLVVLAALVDGTAVDLDSGSLVVVGIAVVVVALVDGTVAVVDLDSRESVDESVAD